MDSVHNPNSTLSQAQIAQQQLAEAEAEAPLEAARKGLRDALLALIDRSMADEPTLSHELLEWFPAFMERHHTGSRWGARGAFELYPQVLEAQAQFERVLQERAITKAIARERKAWG